MNIRTIRRNNVSGGRRICRHRINPLHYSFTIFVTFLCFSLSLYFLFEKGTERRGVHVDVNVEEEEEEEETIVSTCVTVNVNVQLWPH